MTTPLSSQVQNRPSGFEGGGFFTGRQDTSDRTQRYLEALAMKAAQSNRDRVPVNRMRFPYPSPVEPTSPPGMASEFGRGAGEGMRALVNGYIEGVGIARRGIRTGLGAIPKAGSWFGKNVLEPMYSDVVAPAARTAWDINKYPWQRLGEAASGLWGGLTGRE